MRLRTGSKPAFVMVCSTAAPISDTGRPGSTSEIAAASASAEAWMRSRCGRHPRDRPCRRCPRSTCPRGRPCPPSRRRPPRRRSRRPARSSSGRRIRCGRSGPGMQARLCPPGSSTRSSRGWSGASPPAGWPLWPTSAAARRDLPRARVFSSPSASMTGMVAPNDQAPGGPPPIGARGPSSLERDRAPRPPEKNMNTALRVTAIALGITSWPPSPAA